MIGEPSVTEPGIAAAARRDRGFTLVEIMISLAILAIALTGVVALFLRTQRHNQIIAEGRSNLKAAQEVMEIVISDIKRKQSSGTSPDWSAWMSAWNAAGGGTTAYFGIKNHIIIDGNQVDFRAGVRAADTLTMHKDLEGYQAKVEIVDRSTSIGAAPFSLFEIRVLVANRHNLIFRDPMDASLGPAKVEQIVTWRSTK
jgi:prepilin-type N-terminal cleavage/methylation domain-containing protein